jgi:hypothetical protein
MSITSDPHGERIAVTPQAAKAERQPQGTSTGHHVSMAMIGLAVAARVLRDKRTHETAILVVIAVAAARGLGKASRAKSFARLAAWDKRRSANELRKLKPGKPSG